MTGCVRFGIVAHVARQDAALALADRLDATMAIDDGSLGAEANHRRVWEALTHSDEGWACVLEDDAVPVGDFEVQLRAALAVAPSPVVSLYLGTTRPPPVQQQIRRALVRADRADACWVTSKQMLHAVGICLRTELVRDMLDITRVVQQPADERFGRWLRARGYRVAYSVPSLIDHADGPTLIAHGDQQPRDQQRRAWQVGGRERWTSAAIAL